MIAREDQFRESTCFPGVDGRGVAKEPSGLQAVTKRVERKCARSMASHPLLTTVAAMAIGVTLGWLVKRR